MADIKIALAIDTENSVIGDLYLHNGSPRITQTLSEAVAQELFIRLRFFRGEWFLDPTLGFPYFQSVLGQKTPLGIVAQLFRQAILSVPGIKSLDQFNIARTADRGIAPSFSCTLDDGTTLTSADFGDFVIGGA